MQKQRNSSQHPFGALRSVKRRKVKLPQYSKLNVRIIEELDALVCAYPVVCAPFSPRSRGTPTAIYVKKYIKIPDHREYFG